MKTWIFLFFLIFITSVSNAQDSFKITSRSFDSTLFANDDTLTVNDYLSTLRKCIQTLNKTSLIAESFSSITKINSQLNDDDSAIDIVRKRLSSKERIINIRNVQMFNTLLNRINADTKKYNARLNVLDSQLDAIKREIYLLKIDSITNHIFRNQNISNTLKPQLTNLYIKYKNSDSIIKKSNHLIDATLARTSTNLITVGELLSQTKLLLQSTTLKALTKESRYLWEPRPPILANSKIYKNNITDEKKITSYYFKDTLVRLYLLFGCGVIFFYWIFYNLKSVKKLNKLKAFDFLKLKYVNAHPFFTSLIILLSIAPLFDLSAPSIYIEIINVLLILVLTAHFWKKLPGNIFYFWLFFIVIFITLLFIRLFGLEYYVQRNIIFVLNLISFTTGTFCIIKFRKHYNIFKVLFWIGGLYVFFNFLAVLCNLFGRITLTNIFNLTAIHAFIQCLGLTIFVEATKEAFLLQIQSSRIRQGYPEHFEFKDIARDVNRLVKNLALIIWFIVFTSNLNIFNGLSTNVITFLTTIRQIGSFSFSFSGILLFLFIIWCANFLQKYIAYFFGDTGEDAAFENVGQRSKLLITRLVLLVSGFFIAVVASGLPIDRITVILGALGVGIGLGLQGIVNNFVSGIILIFDRPMRIGDTVEIGDKKGRVKEISVRASTLLTPDGAEVIIPNGTILSSNIVNWTLSNSHIRTELNFNVEKISDTESIREEISEIVKTTNNVLIQKPAEILISNITTASTQLKIYFWCKDVTRLEFTKSQIYQLIYNSLEERGIKIL